MGATKCDITLSKIIVDIYLYAIEQTNGQFKNTQLPDKTEFIGNMENSTWEMIWNLQFTETAKGIWNMQVMYCKRFCGNIDPL